MSRKAVLYTRVSTDEQKEKGFSLQDQIARLERHCQKHDMEVLKHYQDDHSAKNFKRPAFQEFLNDVKEGIVKPDVLVCVRMDRFSRNAFESLSMLQKFKTLGIELELLEGDYDLSIPENQIPYVLNMLMAQVDNERRGINTKRGMRQAMREGRWMGSTPRGYAVDKSSGKSLLVPHPKESHFIKQAFQQMAQGCYAMEEVRKKLLEKGYKYISKQQFTNIMRNPVYMGQIRIPAWKNEPEQIVIGLHEPLISEELFHQVQAIINGKPIKAVSHTRKEALPLRGYLICNCCGGKLTGSASTSRNGDKHYYYHCQKGCKERFRADEANDYFITYLEEIQPPKEVLTLYYKVMKDIFKADDIERETELKALTTQIRALESRLENLEDKFVDDLISVESYNRTKSRYDKDLNDLLERKMRLSNQNTSFMEWTKYSFSLMYNLSNYYSTSTLPVKQKIIGSIFPEKLIFDKENYRTAKPNAVLELLSLKVNELPAKTKRLTHNHANQSYQAPPPGLEPGTY